MSPIVNGKEFPYNKDGFAAAAKARMQGRKKGRPFVRTSDGMMLGKSMAKGIMAKMPKAADMVGGMKSKMPNPAEMMGNVKKKVQDSFRKI